MQTTRPSPIKLISAFAAVYIIWGSTFLGVRFASETIPPLLMASVRFLVSGSIQQSQSMKAQRRVALIH